MTATMLLKATQSVRFFLLIALAFFSSYPSQSQEGYKIDLKIAGLKDSVAFLGYYFWENTLSTDTAKVKSNGTLTFEGKKPLPQGIYMLITNRTSGNVKLFEFVIGSDQVFTLETKIEDLVGEMKVTGDADNKIFFDNARYYGERNKEAEPFIKILRDSALSAQNKVEAREGFNKVGAKVKSYQNDIIKKHPETVTARILKSSQEIEVPRPPVLANGRLDSTFQYRYFKAHYWDNFNLADGALLRLQNPVYKDKLKYYLENLVIQNPDSLIKEIDLLAAVARKNKETYKFLVWRCIVEYQHHPVMGMDVVYVHLSDKYVASGEMDFGIDKKTRKNIVDYASQVRRSMIGQTAANLIMLDQNLMPRNMYDISKKYTILFIFDPDCPHCREETPRLVDFYNKYHKKFNLEVFAVCSDSSMKKMRNFIVEMNAPWITVNGPRSYVGSFDALYDAKLLPTLYIIDDRKKIIAKKPPIEKLEEFLTHYEKFQKQKNSTR